MRTSVYEKLLEKQKTKAGPLRNSKRVAVVRGLIILNTKINFIPII